jgi:hypothetical protein
MHAWGWMGVPAPSIGLIEKGVEIDIVTGKPSDNTIRQGTLVPDGEGECPVDLD